MGESNASLSISSGAPYTDGKSADGDGASASSGDGTYHERTGTILETNTSFLTANFMGLPSSFTASSLA